MRILLAAESGFEPHFVAPIVYLSLGSSKTGCFTIIFNAEKMNLVVPSLGSCSACI
jgi:hypothetical protein